MQQQTDSLLCHSLQRQLKQSDKKNNQHFADFKLIYDELKRQYDILLRFDDLHDLTTGVILGFIIVVKVQITLSNGYINTVVRNSTSFLLFFIGFVLIFPSFVFGIRAIFLRDCSLGPKIPILYKQWYYGEQGEKFNRAVFSDIYKAYKENKSAKRIKITLVLWMFGTFAFGIIFIILSRIATVVV